MNCSVNGCELEVSLLGAEVTNKKEKMCLCPNHAVSYALGHVKHKDLKKYKSDLNSEVKCEICGNEGYQYKDSECELNLCEEHLNKLFKYNLLPLEFKKLYKKVGNVYMLHDDFYNPITGEAFQPIEEK